MDGATQRRGLRNEVKQSRQLQVILAQPRPFPHFCIIRLELAIAGAARAQVTSGLNHGDQDSVLDPYSVPESEG